MAFAALGAGEVAAGGLFGASEGEAALNIAGMASGGHGAKSSKQFGGTNLTPLVGMQEHTFDVSNRDAQS